MYSEQAPATCYGRPSLRPRQTVAAAATHNIITYIYIPSSSTLILNPLVSSLLQPATFVTSYSTLGLGTIGPTNSIKPLKNTQQIPH